MDSQNQVDEALVLFRQGFACSQAVLLAFAPHFGLQADLASKIAAPFGGGMGRLGEVCGAVTGAMMVLGLESGNITAEDGPAKETTYARVRDFSARFEQRHGSLLCRELLGCDISFPEGLQKARDEQLFATRCPRFVQDSAELVMLLLEQPPKE